MTAAHRAALRKIGLVNREDSATLAIAKAIVELAKQGERDPDRLFGIIMVCTTGRFGDARRRVREWQRASGDIERK